MNINTIKSYLLQHKVIFISGMPYSGKSTLTNQLSQDHFTKVVRVGDIVRQITQKQSRTFDSALDQEIADRLIDDIKTAYKVGQIMIIDGIRSSHIYSKVISTLTTRCISYAIVWLEVSQQELAKRFYNSRQEKDRGKSFSKLLFDELSLGTVELKNYLVDNHSLLILRNEAFRNTSS